jgi:hypothetical protein
VSTLTTPTHRTGTSSLSVSLSLSLFRTHTQTEHGLEPDVRIRRPVLLFLCISLHHASYNKKTSFKRYSPVREMTRRTWFKRMKDLVRHTPFNARKADYCQLVQSRFRRSRSHGAKPIGKTAIYCCEECFGTTEAECTHARPALSYISCPHRIKRESIRTRASHTPRIPRLQATTRHGFKSLAREVHQHMNPARCTLLTVCTRIYDDADTRCLLWTLYGFGPVVGYSNSSKHFLSPIGKKHLLPTHVTHF